ncbi:MAG: FixH family protein [Thiobacillus sp.]|jgi:nitrogen fixation protein FixH|uniref:FixH family protein n=1 Tax=Thiobacillus sp. TaxID=924 RepID=UPI0028939A12|nr:FixH family protein [Thiobacillus sp.]MDT3706827.1 FixH family protein [Thiobacillus sp.]
MSTMTTLFGGLAAVLVLYAAGGAFRGVPPILRTVLAGVVPLVAYFVLIIGRWPGLDVAAIHISVYLAAALVLFALTQFRQRSAGRMHWAPKLLITFFVGLVFINAILLHIATKGLPAPIARWWLGGHGSTVYSGFSGVVPHDRGAAKAVSSELSQAHRESQVGWQVEVSGLDGEGMTRPLQVRVRDRTGLPVERIEAQLQVSRPGAAAPAVMLPLEAIEAGVYIGALTLPAAGRWLAELRLMQGGELRYQTTLELAAP